MWAHISSHKFFFRKFFFVFGFLLFLMFILPCAVLPPFSSSYFLLTPSAYAAVTNLSLKRDYMHRAWRERVGIKQNRKKKQTAENVRVKKFEKKKIRSVYVRNFGAQSCGTGGVQAVTSLPEVRGKPVRSKGALLMEWRGFHRGELPGRTSLIMARMTLLRASRP